MSTSLTRLGLLFLCAAAAGCNCKNNLSSASYQLSVARSGDGAGQVLSDPAGIECGETCTASFARASTIELTARPEAGSVFTGWTGPCSGTGTCVIQLEEETQVGAGFSLVGTAPDQILKVTLDGSGAGVVTSEAGPIDCGPTCEHAFAFGTKISLSAKAAVGSVFAGWSAACSGVGQCELTMDAPRAVVATFNKVEVPVTNHSLVVTKGGSGAGTVVSSPAGIDCGATCTASYVEGTSVSLTATADPGSTFLGWTGDCTGLGACVVTLSAPRTVTALFDKPAVEKQCEWAMSFGGINDDRGQSAWVDPSGNVLVGGVFRETVDFGSGPVASAANDDGFVIKYTPTGQYAWSIPFGSIGNDGLNAITSDKQGNVYVAAYYSLPLTFAGVSVGTNGQQDGLIAKLNPDGTPVWVKTLGGTGRDSPVGIAVDAAGNVFVSGMIESNLPFAGQSLTTKGFSDAFLVKYAPDGTELWAKTFGGTGMDLGHTIALDKQGNVFLIATTFVVPLFGVPVDMGGGPLMGGGKYDFFLAKYDNDGKHLWSKVFGGPEEDWAWALAVDSAGDLLVAGNFMGNLDTGSAKLVSAGDADIFLMKLSSSGAPLWSKRFGSHTVDKGRGVATDAQNNVYLTGFFTNTAEFGGGPFTSIGGGDIVLAKYDAQGNHLASRQFGGVASWNESWGLAVGPCGPLVTGEFKSTVDFGVGVRTTNGSLDAFIASGGM
jgi:hypothetical protein